MPKLVVNRASGELEELGVPLTEPWEKGATLPTSPVEGQLFLHTPTGRKILMKYMGAPTSAWVPIFGFGDITLYIRQSGPAGTDSQNNGGTNDAGAFLTIQFALNQVPGLNSGNVLINIQNGTFAGGTISGKRFTGSFTLTIQGINAVTNLTTLSGGTTGTQTTGGTSANNLLATVTIASDVTATFPAGSIVKTTISGVATNSIVENASLAGGTTTLRLCGLKFAATPTGSDTIAKFPLTTILNTSLNISSGIDNIIVNDIKFTTPGRLFVSGLLCTATRCSFISDISGFSAVFGGQQMQWNACNIETSSFVGLYMQFALSTIQACRIKCSGGANGVIVSFNSFIVIVDGCVIDGGVSGLALSSFNAVQFTSSTMNNFLKNNVVGLNSEGIGADADTGLYATFGDGVGGGSGNTVDQQGVRNLPTNSGNLASTILFFAPVAGFYQVSIVATVNTAMTTGTETLRLSWTNDDGATFIDMLPLAAADGSETSLARSIYVASGNVTLAGVGTAPTGGNYTVRARVSKL